ncbi:TPA: hypothetical protein F6V52_09770 [Klebsiella oxytoca]|uniref:Uncharacterized protein n=1 Tax=Klebsiella oxytoca TaxID=571 RepID=A0AAD3UI48_KLEOX|nr:hypothetical protein [Klebsiella oxytoca]HAU4361541.1 hypothetical protein [Klebsiella oxytoca]HAU4378051.1 hypothetical protein [Klebsiella oxytoca]HAU4384439.1 hypothetical protein [Klebsiella oxytoca]
MWRNLFLSSFYRYAILCIYTVLRIGGCVDRELNEQVMIERVEMIARLTTEGACQERDREIALDLIAVLAKVEILKNKELSIFFSTTQAEGCECPEL